MKYSLQMQNLSHFQPQTNTETKNIFNDDNFR